MKFTDTQQKIIDVLAQYNEDAVTEKDAQKELVELGMGADDAIALLAEQEGEGDLQEVD